MWRIILTLCICANLLLIGHRHSQAAASITITGANKVYSYGLRRNTTLHSIVTSTPLQLFVEGAQQYAVFFRLAPADLRTIYSALQARVFVDHADRQFTPILINAPAALQSIYTTLQARIFVDHADAQFVPVLVPIILDNGVPTGTVARNGAIGTPTATIQSRQQLTATPTTVPSDAPQPATPVTDAITPSGTIISTSTTNISTTPTVMQPTDSVVAPSPTGTLDITSTDDAATATTSPESTSAPQP